MNIALIIISTVALCIMTQCIVQLIIGFILLNDTIKELDIIDKGSNNMDNDTNDLL